MKSRVRIGYQVDFPPFMTQESSPLSDAGRPSGLVIDALSPAVDSLQEAGADVVWTPLPLPAQEEYLLEGRVDLLAGLGVTTERASRLVFGKPLVRTGGALFTCGGGTRLSRIVTPGSGPLREPAANAFPECEIIDARDYPDALARVVAGDADAAALNIHVGGVFAEREHPGLFELPERRFAVVDLAPAFAPDHDPDLRRLVDVQR